MATSKVDVFEFLAQKANIAGSAIAVGTMLTGAVILDLAVILTFGLAAGGYVAGFLIFSEPKQNISFEQEDTSVELRTIQENVSKLRADLDEHSKRIPDEIMAASENIFTIIEEILPRWKEMTSFAEQKYTINSIITNYFPAIITNYMNLPKSYYRHGAKSKAAEAILEQLGIIQTALEEIRENVYEGVEKDIQVQSQFLKEKFVGKQGFQLD